MKKLPVLKLLEALKAIFSNYNSCYAQAPEVRYRTALVLCVESVTTQQ